MMLDDVGRCWMMLDDVGYVGIDIIYRRMLSDPIKYLPFQFTIFTVGCLQLTEKQYIQTG